MRKRFGLLLIAVLVGGVLVAPSPGNACDLSPVTECVTTTVDAVKNNVDRAGTLVKALPFSAAAYPVKYLKDTGVFAGGTPGVPNAVPVVNTQASYDPSGCDPYPPNAQSCHEYWAGAKWNSHRNGAYKIEWKIYFWTDSANKNITSTYVKCKDWPSGSRWGTDGLCSTGSDPYASPTIGWEAHYHYKQSLCPAAPSIYAHDDIDAEVHANRSIKGTWYYYETAGC